MCFSAPLCTLFSSVPPPCHIHVQARHATQNLPNIKLPHPPGNQFPQPHTPSTDMFMKKGLDGKREFFANLRTLTPHHLKSDPMLTLTLVCGVPVFSLMRWRVPALNGTSARAMQGGPRGAQVWWCDLATPAAPRPGHVELYFRRGQAPAVPEPC